MFHAPRSKPVSKVAGSRRPVTAVSAKVKGKQKAVPKRKGQDLVDEPDAKRIKRRGRVAGTANYSDEDLDALLDLLEEYLPVGGLSWNAVTTSFNEWAVTSGRPERSPKSLEAKFKQVYSFWTLIIFLFLTLLQLVRTTKPTGDAECPPHIERAHFIEDMMSNKVETRELDDVDIIDGTPDVLDVR